MNHINNNSLSRSSASNINPTADNTTAPQNNTRRISNIPNDNFSYDHRLGRHVAPEYYRRLPQGYTNQLETNQLEILKVKGISINDECCICFNDLIAQQTDKTMDKNKKLVFLRCCNKLIHAQCVEEIFKHHAHCPICRTNDIKQKLIDVDVDPNKNCSTCNKTLNKSDTLGVKNCKLHHFNCLTLGNPTE